MSAAIKIPFNALPEQTRARFVGAVSGTGTQPIHAQTTSKTGAYFLWSFVAFGALVAAFTVASDGFGSMYWGRQDTDMLIGYVLAFFVGGYALLAMIRRFVRDKSTPYRRGRYLFGTDLVDATKDAEIVIWPLAQLQSVQAVHQHTNGVYSSTFIHFHFGNKRETLNIRGKAKAETMLNELARTRRAIADAAAARDMQLLQQLDIFAEVRGGQVWNEPNAAAQVAKHVSGNHRASSIPFPLKWASLTALGLSILAVPVFFVRNTLSDDSAFAATRASGRAEDYERYLRYGENHRTEAEELLFQAAFTEAQATGTVSALRDYVREYPTSPHLAQVRQVMHQRFETVKAEFLQQASQSNPAMPVFMSDLLVWLEAHDSPPMQVRFSAPSSETLAELDQTLASRSSNMTPIAPHFTDDRSQPREAGITEVFQRGFRAVFPEDVVSLTHAGRADINQPAPVPSVDIRYEIRPSGATFHNDAGREFVGIHVNFIVAMKVPERAESHEFQVAVQPPEHFTVSYTDYGGPGAGPSDGVVYSTMARLAFEKLSANIALHFFRPGTPAFQQAAGELQAPSGGGRPLVGNGCTNTCNTANDGECDDGGPNSLYSVCDLGTDCADCGPRTAADAGGAGGAPSPQGVPAPNGCTNTCRTANDNECDDGGPNSLYAVCALGTDCADCGPRPPQR
ncbi:MAG: hypothetical protein AAF411_04405 [Myxococcota bacterium]